jgi:ferritin-like metal-binding protein YciE
MAMQSPKDLFIHELGAIFDAEQKLSKMLPIMAQQSNHPEVKDAFELHEQETLQQISNLEQCFHAIGVTPEKATCQAVAGMKAEHDSFLKEKPSADILTMYNLGAGAKSEHYEIASYKGLIEQANLLGQMQCAQLLEQNLTQEEAMAHKIEQLSHKIGLEIASHKK